MSGAYISAWLLVTTLNITSLNTELQWRNWVQTWAGVISIFLDIYIGVNGKKNQYGCHITIDIDLSMKYKRDMQFHYEI